MRKKNTSNTPKAEKRLKSTHITTDVWGRLLRVETRMGYLDNVLQLSGLFLHFRSKEECGGRNDLMETHKCVF